MFAHFARSRTAARPYAHGREERWGTVVRHSRPHSISRRFAVQIAGVRNRKLFATILITRGKHVCMLALHDFNSRRS